MGEMHVYAHKTNKRKTTKPFLLKENQYMRLILRLEKNQNSRTSPQKSWPEPTNDLEHSHLKKKNSSSCWALKNIVSLLNQRAWSRSSRSCSCLLRILEKSPGTCGSCKFTFSITYFICLSIRERLRVYQHFIGKIKQKYWQRSMIIRMGWCHFLPVLKAIHSLLFLFEAFLNENRE